jgi:hypothetical protein
MRKRKSSVGQLKARRGRPPGRPPKKVAPQATDESETKRRRGGSVVVLDVDPARVRQALKLLSIAERSNGVAFIQKALKFYAMSERFFESGGRFKRPYTRRRKAK